MKRVPELAAAMFTRFAGNLRSRGFTTAETTMNNEVTYDYHKTVQGSEDGYP